MSDRPIGRLRAYAAGADAYDRGEPAQPPPTIPSHRKDAWLAGWADLKAFTECQTAGRKRSRAKPGSNRFVAAADKIEPLGRFIRTTGSLPPTAAQPRRKTWAGACSAISADLGAKLSHVTIRKIIAGRQPAGRGSAVA